MNKEKIERINFLAKKSREVGLTDEEKTEHAKLREEYVAAFKKNLRAQLDNMYILDEKGNKKKIEKKEVKGS